MKRLNFASLLLLFLVASCSTNPNYDPTKAHHTQYGFQNIAYRDDKGLVAFIKWRWERLFQDIPGADDYDFTIDRTHHEFVKNNTKKPTLTWIGAHSY